MKRIIIALIGVLCIVGLAGCGDSKQEKQKHDDAKYQVVCTIFPQYDWVREVIGSQSKEYDLTMLLDNGVDLHSYQPTAEDIAKISECDMFIYVGGESDEWVEDALKEKRNEKMRVINLLDVLGDKVKEEELVEGMQGAEDEEHNHEEHDHEEPEYDEHVWLSVRNANALVEHISEQLSELDSAHKDLYQSNAKAYQDKLSELDQSLQKVAEDSKTKTLLFGDRFPFRYLTDDYGLTYYAAFVGCSAETEASFDTITFLANKVDELQLPCVMTIESSDQKIAKAILSNTKGKGQKILALDSLQSVTADKVTKGATYLEIMKKNLEVLKEALQ